MRPTFQPFLVNDPFHDPCLYINCLFQNRAVTFDLGDIQVLSAKAVLKISHCFISHTHIDHFAGFDRLLRLTLGRDKQVHFFGPENFLKNIEGKLAAYSWNLAANYDESLTIQATEIRAGGTKTRTYECRRQFEADETETAGPFTGVLLSEPGFTVAAAILDHDLPCLAFRLDEHFHVNINKPALTKLGLETGPWLNDFKQRLMAGGEETEQIRVPRNGEEAVFEMGALAEEIAIITPGQTVTYITDVAGNPENLEKMTAFARNSDHLFIESHFLEADRETARAKYHLTARQAGEIAGLAGVRRLTTFHYSPRYTDRTGEIAAEAQTAFEGSRFRG
jgi:ribonuclease Z